MTSNFSEILLRITGSLFYILPILIFIILAIYYMSKTQSSKEGALILIGNILILIVAILHQFLYLFIDDFGFDLYAIINVGVNAISFVGSVLFLIGLYMMIQKIINTQKDSLKN
ncbi:hypothetical protein [Aquimarina muelleri]|uniref:Uncharacterized protein n=1 Tax=Aquimarina muelleri TaxID=279356 RepID=A0A918JV08_9FLAO|nr:hypothetical protein [Aquimarina muelleri]MCX2762957.1 hypothetical protein [Aquimarina muelleri]GGX14993.1 hypothetical protein GCM10007384_15850 [Aquimarina muelleri]